MPDRVRRNIAALDRFVRLVSERPTPGLGYERLAGWPARSLSGLLLEGFETGDFGGLDFTSELSVPRQLQQLFERAPGGLQDELRRATVTAIADWAYPSRRYAVLGDLAYLAAYFRVSESALPLADAFDLATDSATSRATEGERAKALASTVGALAGLGATAEVRAACTRLLFRRDLDPRFAAQLLLALARSSPRDLPTHLERFWRLAETRPGFFELDVIVERLVDVVPMPMLIEGLPHLSPDVGHAFVRRLTGGRPPLVTITFEPSSAPVLEDRDGRRFPIVFQDRSNRQRMESLLAEYLIQVDVPTSILDLHRDLLDGLRGPAPARPAGHRFDGVTDAPRPEFAIVA